MNDGEFQGNNGEITRFDVLKALDSVPAPGSAGGLAASGMIQGLVIRDGEIGFIIEIPAGLEGEAEPLQGAAEEAVRALPGVRRVTAVVTAHKDTGGGLPRQQRADAMPPRGVRVSPPGGRPAPRAATTISLPGVRNVIAVASGKGGVGKSTVAVNLAVALARRGLKTGLLDADIYGPSVPRMLGIGGLPAPDRRGKVRPAEAWGVKAMSIGFLVDTDTALIWRGPMVMGALTQMLGDVDWGDLDVLVVDMPPGTGDAQLTLAQRVPLAGAVIVSTPQEIALIDARKGIALFDKTHVPILGLVENMSGFTSPETGETIDIFGRGGARRTAETFGVPFLGELPIDVAIRETSDHGQPIAASAPDSPAAQAFLRIADKVVSRLNDLRNRKRPRIIFE
jgi:ATP-binding protein involved in chromosome partitioning